MQANNRLLFGSLMVRTAMATLFWLQALIAFSSTWKADVDPWLVEVGSDLSLSCKCADMALFPKWSHSRARKVLLKSKHHQ